MVVNSFLKYFSTQISFAKSKVFFWVVRKAKSIQNVFKPFYLLLSVSNGIIGKHNLAIKGGKMLYFLSLSK